jgi:YebC/PmpR family DNA-binding regulatory protein
MSGHSKWKTIQHKKGAADAKRGKMFSKLSRELMVLARRSGGNPDMNPALRACIQKAKSINMPADNVDRAIKKGTGELGGVTYEETMYEGFAAGTVSVVVSVLTDNKNRTTAELRHIFGKHGSSLAAQGAVSRGFERKGQIIVDAAAADEDKLMGIALDAGAEDMVNDGGQFEILTDPASFSAVSEAVEKAGIKPVSAEVALVPKMYVPVSEKAVASSVLKFVSDLEDHDDVQNVYTNMDIADEVLKELSKED